jgi:4-hydroxy-3-polyprenylbenzoate decarboxylase
MGGIKEAPVELIKCETNGLLVPANSEIVLEGEVSMDPETFVPEGPFGEYPGYYSDVKPQLSPVFKVNCITHRNDPIMTSCLLGTGPDLVPADHEYFCSITMAAQIWDHLERCGVLGIDDVSLDLNATSTIVYIAINKMYYGQAKQVAAALWGGPLSIYLGKYVIVVDSDVDIRDRGRIMSAIANRTYPKSDIIIYPGTFGGPLDPGTPPEIKDIYGRMGHWDRVLIDATWPFEWKPREEWGGSKHPVSCLAEEDTLEKVRNKWGMYGFK